MAISFTISTLALAIKTQNRKSNNNMLFEKNLFMELLVQGGIFFKHSIFKNPWNRADEPANLISFRCQFRNKRKDLLSTLSSLACRSLPERGLAITQIHPAAMKCQTPPRCADESQEMHYIITLANTRRRMCACINTAHHDSLFWWTTKSHVTSYTTGVSKGSLSSASQIVN